MTPREQIRQLKQWLEEERAFEKALDEALFWPLDQEQQRLAPQARPSEHETITDDTDGPDPPGLGAATTTDGDPADR